MRTPASDLYPLPISTALVHPPGCPITKATNRPPSPSSSTPHLRHKSRPRANNRSTNFWAWFGKGLEKLGDMGSASAPREAYGVESEKVNNRNQKKDSERNVSRRKALNTRPNSNHEYFLENIKIEIRQKTGGYIDSVVTNPNKPDTLYQINPNGDIRQKWIRIHNHFDLLK